MSPERAKMKPYLFYSLLAESDQNLFIKEVKSIGFRIHDHHIESISHEISEDVDDSIELPDELAALRNLLDALGYVVSYNTPE